MGLGNETVCHLISSQSTLVSFDVPPSVVLLSFCYLQKDIITSNKDIATKCCEYLEFSYFAPLSLLISLPLHPSRIPLVLISELRIIWGSRLISRGRERRTLQRCRWDWDRALQNRFIGSLEVLMVSPPRGGGDVIVVVALFGRNFY